MDSPVTPAATPAPKALAWSICPETGADMIGELISGRHRIIRRIARGGMAEVFLAKDQTRKARVAIKILRSHGREVRRRFGVEAVLLSNLQHAGIVRAIDVGETSDGRPYMALEYLEGEPLSHGLARGPLPWRDVVAYGIQIASAVHALHVAGIIHRDLKPHNIMLTTDGDRSIAKLIDLGLASVGAPFQDAQDARFTPDPPERHPTLLGQPIGTPMYLPPEAGLCPAEPRLDVYALGVTLYQLCTQTLPDATGVRPIRAACPGSDAPDDLSRLLAAALAPDVNERLPSADQLRRGLEAILAAHPQQGARHLFGGSFDRLEVLGIGASAVVFRASDRWLSREVAVKVLRDAGSEDDVIRFRRAAKVLSALNHPNIPRILHVGHHEGECFAVTELCPGAPATSVVRPDHHLRPDETIAVGLQLAGALAAVHAAGIVYRDLHPGNVLIARGEPLRASIFDFDQAQVSAEFFAALTERWATPPEARAEPQQEKPLHKMDYAAPEVRAGAAFSAASDVYALGFLLYRLLTGKRPFPVSGGEPVPARKVCPACPRGLEGLLMMMLGPTPDTRPTLATIQATLEYVQAELAADLAEHEDSGAADEPAGPLANPGEPAPVAVADTAAAADTVAATAVSAAGPPAVFVAVTDATATAADAEPASRGRQDGGAEPARDRRARRGVSPWALGLTAAACLAIGRASVGRDEPDLDREATAASPMTGAADRREVPGAPSVYDEAPIEQAVIETPPAPPPPDQAQPKRDGAPRAERRGAVTPTEATTAAQRAVPGLRACTDVPRVVTADLEIVRGRAVVTALNFHAPAPNDRRYPWHGCAQRRLETVRFPTSETAGRVQVRLTLR